jgi:hypothetical protein
MPKAQPHKGSLQGPDNTGRAGQVASVRRQPLTTHYAHAQPCVYTSPGEGKIRALGPETCSPPLCSPVSVRSIDVLLLCFALFVFSFLPSLCCAFICFACLSLLISPNYSSLPLSLPHRAGRISLYTF